MAIETTREIIFINRCCQHGYAGLKNYVKEMNPRPTIKEYNLFNAYHLGLLELYKIDKDKLVEKAYIIDDGKVIEIEN